MKTTRFLSTNVQTIKGNQNRFQGNNFYIPNHNQNRGNNFNQNRQGAVYQTPPYQPPINQTSINQALPYQSTASQIQGVSKTDFDNYVKANDAVLKNVQNQGQNLQNQMANVTSLLTSLCNNFNNFASTLKLGTLPSQTVTNPREHVNAITTRSGKTLEGPSTPLVPIPVVSIPSKEPEQNPETSMDKVQKPSLESTAQVPSPEEEDSIFMEIPKPKAKKTVNPNSPRPNSYQPKLPYPERMKVRENDKPSAQHSRFLKMFKQLRLEIRLKDALVEMPKFNKWLSSLLRNKEKLEEIAIKTVNAECSAIIMNKVPEKLKDPGKFLIPCALQELDRTSALADSGASINLLPHSIYKQLGLGALTPTRMTLELANRSITHPMGIAEDVLVRVDDKPFRGSTTNHSETLPPSSSPVKTSDNLEEFADEITPLKIDMDVDVENKNSNVSDSDEPVLLNTPLSNKDECFALEDDIDEIDAFLAMEVSFNFEEEQNESSITFSPRSDPLHHGFAEEIITLPLRNDCEFEEILSLMTVLCEISTSRSRENVHANQSSIIESLLIEDSEPVQEEIDIFLVPDDLIPPGVENDDSEDEDIELPNLDHQDNPSSPRPPPEPSDVCLNFKHATAINDEDFNQGPTLVSDLPFISSIVSFENEDTIFDPGIVTFLRAGGIF
ncbi:reverse transcriptase domain-containing protein [Tanacetum coccineum]